MYSTLLLRINQMLHVRKGDGLWADIGTRVIEGYCWVFRQLILSFFSGGIKLEEMDVLSGFHLKKK